MFHSLIEFQHFNLYYINDLAKSWIIIFQNSTSRRFFFVRKNRNKIPRLYFHRHNGIATRSNEKYPKNISK